MKIIALLLILCGCTVGPKYCPPDPDVPTDWQGNLGTLMQRIPPDDTIWWKRFNDPLLNQLITYAADQNLDLNIAGMRVLQARLAAKGKGAEKYPRIDGSLACGRAVLPKGIIKDLKRDFNFYEAGFDAEWEIDLFGKTAHDLAAACAEAEAAQESLNGVWITLSAEIARNYIELRGLQMRLNLLQTSLEMQQQAFGRLQELSERGIHGQVNLNQARGEQENLQAEEPLLALQITRAIHRISILLGYPPGELLECLTAFSPLPSPIADHAIGLPSDLVRRRPDIRKAERELAAATEKVGSAIASLFPRFSLRGFIGDISTHAGKLFNPSSATALVGPQLLVPIFNSRLLLEDVQYNKISTQIALYNYQKTVLEALEEAENGIAAYAAEEKRYTHLENALEEFQQASAFTNELYERGINDYISVNAAEKNALAAQTTLVQSQVNLLLHTIALYKALGGAWDPEPGNCNIAYP